MAEDEPDFTIDYLQEMGTKEQLATVGKLEQNGWRATHLFEYEMGWLAVWCIARRKPSHYRKSGGFIHCFVKPSGEVISYSSSKGKSRRAST